MQTAPEPVLCLSWLVSCKLRSTETSSEMVKWFLFEPQYIKFKTTCNLIIRFTYHLIQVKEYKSTSFQFNSHGGLFILKELKLGSTFQCS